MASDDLLSVRSFLTGTQSSMRLFQAHRRSLVERPHLQNGLSPSPGRARARSDQQDSSSSVTAGFLRATS